MTKEKVIEKFEKKIDFFEKLNECEIEPEAKSKVLKTFAEYIQFLTSKDDTKEIDEKITGPAVEYCFLKASAIESTPLAEGGFMHRGDRSEEWRRSIDNDKADQEREPYKNVKIDDLEDDPTWDKTKNDQLPGPIGQLEDFMNKHYQGKESKLFKSYSGNYDLLYNSICERTPPIDPDLKTLKVKWWKQVQSFKHKLALEFCVSNNKKSSTPGPRSPYQEMWDYIEYRYDKSGWDEKKKQQLLKEHGSVSAAANGMIEHLKNKFPEKEKYPTNTSMREKLGYKESSGTRVLGKGDQS